MNKSNVAIVVLTSALKWLALIACTTVAYLFAYVLRFDVPVPKSMGPILWLNQALPFRARLALAHLTKADDVLSHIDIEQRAAYVERVRASAS